jgi:serine/threonine-protein kinase HipA
MKIGGEYRLKNIGLKQWEKFAAELRLEIDWLLARMRTMADAFPDHIATIQKTMANDGLSHPTISRLARRLTTRAASCQRILH